MARMIRSGPQRVRSYRHFHRIAWLAVALALGVIVFGAFVRLSNAGLSCPDWPTCYGRAAWPTAAAQAAEHAATAIRPVEPHKAWREQLHRHLAATLGLLVLVLALLAARRQRFGVAWILGATLPIALGIPLYMHGEHVLAFALAALGEGLLLAAALRWSIPAPDVAQAPLPAPNTGEGLASVAALTLMVIVFQALLGMWTVTWLLKPVVVMGHLLGGLLTFALLSWMAWRATDVPIRLAEAVALRRWALVVLALLALQIALGGWTSANYAALACGNDFPRCVGQWWPRHDFREAFVLWRGIGVDYEGGVLDGESRIAIQLAHRMMAVIAFAALLAYAVRLWRSAGMRGWAALLALLACAQVALGIANVRLQLPLTVAVLHNAGAALLLFVLVTLLARVRRPD
jgi:cytochrome c oxidase assembly protein subunit 15